MIETLDALLLKVNAGSGAWIVVEGETAQDDPWYYDKWFGDLAREVSFVHQNGFVKVKRAVAHLREHAPWRPVYGIIDRDFATRDETDVGDPLEPGLYRTGWFTLENYFLADLDAWMQILDTLTAGAPPPGWDSREQIGARILDAYRASLPVAAWNRVVHEECLRTGLREGSPGSRTHHNAINDETLDKLTQWGHSRGAPIALCDRYREHLDDLTALPPDRWPEFVTGKAVFIRFAEKFPELRSDVKLRRLYIAQQPKPPPDLAAIVDEIRREAAKLRNPGS
jgi:hypothetical protein